MGSAGTRTSRTRHFIDVIFYRAAAELRAEATRTYAGYLWWVILPLLSLGIYYVAFQHILDRGGDGFAMFLFSGIIFWQWFHLSVLRCSNSLIASRGLMQQLNLHKTVFPLSIVVVNTFKFAITLVLLLVVLIGAGYSPTASWLCLPLLLALQLALIVGLGCTAAAISPFLPDFQLMLETALQLFFFLSGVFFELSTLSPRLAAILQFNPIAVLISQYRRVLLHGQWIQPGELLLPLAEILFLLGTSAWLIHRYDKVYAKLC